MTLKTAEIENLLRMSEEQDEAGNTEQAEALHIAALKMVVAAEKDKKEESAGFGFSGKQKSAIKGLLKAAERADKVFGNKIPRSCRKISSLVDDLIEECEKCDLD